MAHVAPEPALALLSFDLLDCHGRGHRVSHCSVGVVFITGAGRCLASFYRQSTQPICRVLPSRDVLNLQTVLL